MNGEDKVVELVGEEMRDGKRYSTCGWEGRWRGEGRAFLVGKATASTDLAPDQIRIRTGVTPAGEICVGLCI